MIGVSCGNTEDSMGYDPDVVVQVRGTVLTPDNVVRVMGPWWAWLLGFPVGTDGASTWDMTKQITWTEKTATYGVDKGYERIWYVSETLNHGVVDKKGREVGGYAMISKIDRKYQYGHFDANNVWVNARWIPVEVVTWELEIRSTRDAVTFGAIPARTNYPTLEQAQAAAAKKLAAQGRHYAKQFAPKVSP